MENGRENAWNTITLAEREEVFTFADGYKDFITQCKTEWEAAAYFKKELQKNGFVDLEEIVAAKKKLAAGDRVFRTNRGRSICASVIGKNGVQNGFSIVAAHTDSPNVFMRQNAFFEEPGVVCAKTFSRGGIKEYQWATTPLAIHANIVMPDNSIRTIVIGEKEEDPILYIDDLSMHLSAEELSKTMREGIKGENLNVIMGSIPLSGKDGQKAYLLDLLQKEYGLTERQFYGAEIYFVPAMKARDAGLDRSMIAAYGQDDRVCTYLAFQALLDGPVPENTAVIMLQDKEETGNFGNTSASSSFFADFLKDLYELITSGFDRHRYTAVQSLSKVLNGDVTTLLQPMDYSMLDVLNSGILGGGACMDKYICGALYDYVGYVTNLLDKNNVAWQFSVSSKSKAHGGSSTSNSFLIQNMDVLNLGPGIYSMHSCYELLSKIDLFMSYKAYNCFLHQDLVG